ncbi:MAG TPA: IS5/IS1182 family transposase, partial [Pseudonocardiaceae bacterium]|nr:IS5/IS1182 family transposase [Pseudonocardiaceae bacterium]
ALLVGRWRALRHITTSPRKIGTIVKAALVLTHFEHGRID